MENILQLNRSSMIVIRINQMTLITLRSQQQQHIHFDRYLQLKSAQLLSQIQYSQLNLIFLSMEEQQSKAEVSSRSFETNEESKNSLEPAAAPIVSSAEPIKPRLSKSTVFIVLLLLVLLLLQLRVATREQECKTQEPEMIPLAYNLARQWVPITYIWLGDKVPARYAKRAMYSKYPYLLLNEAHWKIIGWEWQKYKSLQTIEKADILRLLFVYNYGGIYSDLDVVCDYDKLFLDLPTQKGCYFAGHADQPVYPDGITNSFLYCTDRGDPLLKELIDSIRNNVQKRQKTGKDPGILQTTGPIELRRHSKLKALPRYYKYCYHEADATWRKKK